MLFNSIEFAIFLPIVFVLYWFVLKNKTQAQNILLLGASYLFYGWWDWRFLSLIIFSSFVDYFVGIQLEKSNSRIRRKVLLWTSIGVNVGFLGFFKYFNFFAESFADAFTFFGYSFNPTRLDIILPVGISFYTFQTLSYSIDVYKRKLNATTDVVAFFSFVSFFPQLVAGPIERASHLLPQFYGKRKFDKTLSIEGLRQILWGLFKKVVIADNCAYYVNDIFANYTDYSGSTLLLGAVFFAFQIYGDFSGYSDIAIGTARLFGFDLMRNFAYPYFARDIAEFWRRWHISLSTWFRDYLYIPLGGSRGTKLQGVRNTIIIFVVSGFWHGANWTFVFWGVYHSLLFLPLFLVEKNRHHTNDVAENSLFPSIKEMLQMTVTFLFVVIGWVLFRAANLTEAFGYLSGILDLSVFTLPSRFSMTLLFFIAVLQIVEWLQREAEFGLARLENIVQKRYLRWIIYILISFVIIQFGGKSETFIYFQF